MTISSRVTLSVLLAPLLLPGAAPPSPERLHNGITLPPEWPPRIRLTAEPMAVPYLAHPPATIPIDIGRQLFVDDFLVENTTLQRTHHRPDYHPGNPVLRPEAPWESAPAGSMAGPFSGGVWYDARDRLFKMWYFCGYIRYTCYATSTDGVRWTRPDLDVVPGTNIVIDHLKELKPAADPKHAEEQLRRVVDTSSIWIDYGADPDRRYKIFYTGWSPGPDPTLWRAFYRHSRDGIHWSREPAAVSGEVGDHTNAHYNPFRKKWVMQIRYNDPRRGRARLYLERDDPAELTRLSSRGEPAVPWLAADGWDPRNPDPDRARIQPELYHFDGIAYESLMLGWFSVWQGPENVDARKLRIQKRNEVLAGYSRDGFHYSRPSRMPMFHADETPGAWNWGNVQSATGACVVVGDKLYLYFSSRMVPKDRPGQYDGYVSTGLATLRRDGFVSMDSAGMPGALTTRPVRFTGKHLFVNVRCPQGELRAEVLDEKGTPIEPFTRERCEPVAADRTLRRIVWKGAPDLSRLAGRTVRFRFHLRLGELYSFWVAQDASGASGGYVGSGGPGYAGFVDREGEAAVSGRP